jgi:rhamnogalacturonan endolyase
MKLFGKMLLSHMRGWVLLILFANTTQLFSQRLVEKLDRGVVAVRMSASTVFISWRLLAPEYANTAFNVYRAGVKLNTAPITGATNFTDFTVLNQTYTVKPVVNGIEGASSSETSIWSKQYIQIPLTPPDAGTSPDGVAYTYSANDASAADLDGDGSYEIILKWDPSNSKDNSLSGYTGNVFIDAYKLSGQRLWRIDLGRNIRAGAHYTQFLVYDFDSDGKAEMACRTSDASKDAAGTWIGDSSKDYRTTAGYILSGPEFLSIFNGETGRVMDTKDYTPARGTVSSWGDSYGNRVDRFLAAVAYLDGVSPSMIFARGYYTRLVRSAWDFKNGKLVQRWIATHLVTPPMLAWGIIK